MKTIGQQMVMPQMRRVMFFLIIYSVSWMALALQAAIPVVVPRDCPEAVKLAAADLRRCLEQIYPQETFVPADVLPQSGMAILVGVATDTQVRSRAGEAPPTKPESCLVRVEGTGANQIGVITGADARGVVHGVYALLEKLGCCFHLAGDVLPPARKSPFDFKDWHFADQPEVGQRLVFDWHNFLSGCSTWNLSDWQRWTAQSQKMGYNAIMVHAYGNNPMAGFNFNGVAKPVGYLSTTVKGRDWSTMHVNDVQRLYGGNVFTQPVFGADAGCVPDAQRVTAAQSLMHNVFSYAAQRDMGVYFAVDVDTPSANPQELVMMLPESARFQAGGASETTAGKSPSRIWLPNPDALEGYAYYKAQVESLVRTYPDITKLVVWFRRGGTPWTELKTNNLPLAWQKEYAAEIERTPAAGKYWRAPGLFGIGKIVRAFDRALKECGAKQVTLASGTWGFEFLPACDRFFPEGVPLIGLDYDVIHEKPQLGMADSRAPLREIGAHRPLIPIMWAHHDDGHYIGRPYTPLPQFASKLEDARASGFGIIHWTTRPLDLYFTSLSKQVWQSTKDQTLGETCRNFAAGMFGAANREIMGTYLEEWMQQAPRFARETSDFFIDRRLTNIAEVVAGCSSRLDRINQASMNGLTQQQRQNLEYQRGLEQFISAFHQAHGKFQESQDLLKKGDLAEARKVMALCHPEPVIEQFASFSSSGGMTRGEQGLVVSLNTRWLSHIIRHRQALGLDPVRIRFTPTSHDMLAQSRGLFSFHFSQDKTVWECWGLEETGAPVFTLPSTVIPVMQESLPAAWNEICRAGIESDKPVALAFRPILAKDSHGKNRSMSLPAGEYLLRLLMLDPTSTAAGQSVFDLSVGELPNPKTVRVDVYQEAGGKNRVLERTFPVVLSTNGMVRVTLTPVVGKAVLSGAVVEPKGIQ